MTDLLNIRLLATHPHRCSYLPDQEATTVFVDPNQAMSGGLYAHLSALGFRRSGNHVYRPQCANCQACIPARIPVQLFKPSRQQKRCMKRNAEIELLEVDTIDTEEHYKLYETYISERHRDGDMYPASIEQFRGFLTKEWDISHYFELRLNGALAGVFVSDQLTDALSAVYTYFDPALANRSLGTLAILLQIERAKKMNLRHLYLGYWIKNSPKMNYKYHFRPLELLLPQGWTLLN
ncbi:arginyltransferase [Aurantivibrio infirmus]